MSWDKAYPRSCAVFGIKSRQLPSLLVRRHTGRHCPVFSPVAKAIESKPGEEERLA